jgi:hypothetical protein
MVNFICSPGMDPTLPSFQTLYGVVVFLIPRLEDVRCDAEASLPPWRVYSFLWDKSHVDFDVGFLVKN